MLSVIYGERCKKALYAECRDAERSYANRKFC
jgi:hypothetical protein